MLKKSVPADWMTADHQAALPPSGARRWGQADQLCRNPPAVKRTDPTKKVTPSADSPTSCTYPGKGPMKKQVEPSAKQSAIQRWRLMGLRSGPNRVEVRSELLELVADPGRLLEAEIVGRGQHLLLELDDELLELLRG